MPATSCRALNVRDALTLIAALAAGIAPARASLADRLPPIGDEVTPGVPLSRNAMPASPSLVVVDPA